MSDLDAPDSPLPAPKRRKAAAAGGRSRIADDDDDEAAQQDSAADDAAMVDASEEGTGSVASSPVKPARAAESEGEAEGDESTPATRRRLSKASDSAAAASPAPVAPSSPPAPTSGKTLRPKRDLSAAEKKRIEKATAERKNQPSVASFFGGGAGGGGSGSKPAKGSIASFFQKPSASPAADSAAPTATPAVTPSSPTASPAPAPSAPAPAPTATEQTADLAMDETGTLTSLAPPAAASPAEPLAAVVARSPAKAKPTAAKRKRDEVAAAAEQEKEQKAQDAKKQKEEKSDESAAAPMDLSAAESSPAAPAAAAAEPAAAAPASEKVAPAAAPASSKKPSAAATSASKKKAAAAPVKPAAASKRGGKKSAKAEEEEEEESSSSPPSASLGDDADADARELAAIAQEEAWNADIASLSASVARASSGKGKNKLTSKDLTDESGFDPLGFAASWPAGEVPYSALADAFALMESPENSGRLRKICILSNFLRSVLARAPEQLITVVYLACNQIAPAYEGKETQVGEGLLQKSIIDFFRADPARTRASIMECGDMGTVAGELRKAQQSMSSFFKLAAPKKGLTCRAVLKAFRDLSVVPQGTGAQEKRSGIIKRLLGECGQSTPEAKYIVRALEGNLRTGMAAKGVVSALARAVTLTPPSKSVPPPVLDARLHASADEVAKRLEENIALINQAYIEVPNHDEVVGCILTHGVSALPQQCVLKPGVPVKVMLGKPSNGVEAILEKFGGKLFTLEYKYDGSRAQIHRMKDGSVKIYSRNSEDDTPKYPDVITRLPLAFGGSAESAAQSQQSPEAVSEEQRDPASATPAIEEAAASSSSSRATASSSEERKEGDEAVEGEEGAHKLVPPPLLRSDEITDFIIDCEMVAWDRVKHKILPFQALSTRKRKDVRAEDVQVDTSLFAFDMLYLNGTSYMDRPLAERRAVLRSSFHPVPDSFEFATSLDTPDPELISAFMQRAVRDSCEGLMIKSLWTDASYVPDKRNWLKLKKDYMEGVADSLDLVVIGGWHGKGKRTGAYGAFLLATFDPETEDYQSICKIGTGLSDEFLDSATKALNAHILPSPPRYYQWGAADTPDVWFDAKRIWEIRCADLSISPLHKAAVGKVHESRGIALRFPRFIREREDKSPPDGVTSADQVVHLFQSQSVQGGDGGNIRKGPPR